MKRGVTVLLVALLVTPVLGATLDKSMSGSSAAFGMASSVVPRGGSYTTGFESPFTVGFMDNQQSWTSFGGVTQPQISTAHPAAGTQHVRIADDPSIGYGYAIGSSSPSVSPAYTTGEQVIVSMDVAINASGGADFYVEPYGVDPNGAGVVNARMRFYYTNAGGGGAGPDIIYLDADPNGALGYYLTGTDWIPGSAYHNVKIVFNVGGTGAIDYYYNNTLILHDANGFGSSAVNMTGVEFFDDNYNNFGSPSTLVDVDNVSITPEPASLALLGLLVLMRRR